MQLRYYQEDAINSIYDYFIEKSGNPVLALPTGTGKSVIIAKFIERVLKTWPHSRILGLTHVKELVQQNSAKIKEAWPLCPLGVYSAGLGRKDIEAPVIFGGVASVNNSEAILNGHWDLVIIDEAHLISSNADTMYGRILTKLRDNNPRLKIIGLSATPFRMGQGLITDGGIFTEICYNLTKLDDFTRLIAEGFMSPLIPKKTETLIDISNVKIVAGEFNEKQLQEATDRDEITTSAVKEMIQYAHTRKSWLIFAAGVKHAIHIATMLNIYGIAARAIHSDMGNTERDATIDAFKTGSIRAIVNNNILTTGFDHPPVDFMGILRATMSTALWVQMLGRGTRPAPGKDNCLVLDFARNTVRLGPINDPNIPKRKGNKVEGETPVKICDFCGCYNHASVRHCVNCGTEFQIKTKIAKTASEVELIRNALPQVEYFDVTFVRYEKHSRKQPPTLKVTYNCGMRQFTEYVCFEHSGYALKLARDWWRKFHWMEPPDTIDTALELSSTLKPPRRIGVWVNKEYPEIMSHEHY